MSCPHQTLFSCEDCIKESIRVSLSKKSSQKTIFELLHEAQDQIRDLEYKLKIVEGQRDYESGVLELITQERNELRKGLIGLMKRSRELANDYEYPLHDNYWFWYQFSLSLLDNPTVEEFEKM